MPSSSEPGPRCGSPSSTWAASALSLEGSPSPRRPFCRWTPLSYHSQKASLAFRATADSGVAAPASGQAEPQKHMHFSQALAPARPQQTHTRRCPVTGLPDDSGPWRSAREPLRRPSAETHGEVTGLWGHRSTLSCARSLPPGSPLTAAHGRCSSNTELGRHGAALPKAPAAPGRSQMGFKSLAQHTDPRPGAARTARSSPGCQLFLAGPGTRCSLLTGPGAWGGPVQPGHPPEACASGTHCPFWSFGGGLSCGPPLPQGGSDSTAPSVTRVTGRGPLPQGLALSFHQAPQPCCRSSQEIIPKAPGSD